MSKAISRVVLAVVVIVVIIAVVGAAIALTHKSTTITPSASSSSLITSATTTPVTLTLVTFSDPANEWMQYAASVFEAQHPGVTIKIVSFSFSQYLTNEILLLKRVRPLTT